jgi:hypothetical protein
MFILKTTVVLCSIPEFGNERELDSRGRTARSRSLMTSQVTVKICSLSKVSVNCTLKSFLTFERVGGGPLLFGCLRHCAIHQKDVGLIPDGVLGIYHWLNPSGRTMALGATQPVTEMSTRNISWGKGSQCIRLTTLPPSYADCLETLGAPTSWSPKCLSRYSFLPSCQKQLISGLNVIQSVFLPFFLSSFPSYSDIFYLFFVGLEDYCCTWLHWMTHTNGKTPLDEWSARHRDLYLTTHDTHKKQTSMPPVETWICNHNKRAASVPCLKADTHITCRVHAAPMPFPCNALPLIHICHAAPLPCSDSVVSFVRVRVVAGNIRTASPTV